MKGWPVGPPFLLWPDPWGRPWLLVDIAMAVCLDWAVP